MNSKFKSFEKKFLRQAIDFVRCRYETMTGLDSHGGTFDKDLYLRGYTLMGELDHKMEMEILCQEYHS